MYIRYNRAVAINWQQTRLTLGTCGRVRCEPGWRLDRQWSSTLRDFDLWLVWAGLGRMQLRDRTIELRPGTCLWARPGGLYLAEQDPARRLGVNFIHFDLRDRRGRRLADRELPPEVQEVDDLHLFDSVMQRVVTLARAGAAPAAVWMQALLVDLAQRAAAAATAGGAAGRHHRRIAEVAARLQESPAEAPPVAELARQTGFSVDHFGRVFREVTGLGPEAFIIRARVTRAQQLLRETELAVGAVAEALGYCDPYFFSRQFKQQTGRTPLQFRRQRGGDFHV